jgi:hypothetical protein
MYLKNQHHFNANSFGRRFLLLLMMRFAGARWSLSNQPTYL